MYRGPSGNDAAHCELREILVIYRAWKNRSGQISIGDVLARCLVIRRVCRKPSQRSGVAVPGGQPKVGELL